MLKEAIEKIESMAWKHIVTKDGRMYTDLRLAELIASQDVIVTR